MVTPVMAMDRFAVAVPPSLSVTVTVNEDVPVVVGVPLMTPVDGARVRPGGSIPVLAPTCTAWCRRRPPRVWIRHSHLPTGQGRRGDGWASADIDGQRFGGRGVAEAVLDDTLKSEVPMGR